MSQDSPVQKVLVLDANILLRAVLGVRTRNLLRAYGDFVEFYAPDICFEDARSRVAELAAKRGFDPNEGLMLLDELDSLVALVDDAFYAEHESAARRRIAARDPDDWPILATALLLDCAIWTEDQDFFGCGVATWTTRNVEIYMRGE